LPDFTNSFAGRLVSKFAID